MTRKAKRGMPAKRPAPSAPTTAPRPRGNQTVYTAAIAAAILERLSGGEALNAICKDDGLPDERTVRAWVTEDREGFAPKYAHAREIGMDVRADGLRDLAASALGLTSEGVSAVKLMVETERWYMGKVAPKRYGEKLQLDVEDHRPTTPEARRARIQELIALGVGKPSKS